MKIRLNNVSAETTDNTTTEWMSSTPVRAFSDARRAMC